MTGAVDHWHASPPRCGEQPLRGWHGLPGMLATGAGEFPVHVFDRPVPAEISLVVEVDGQNGRVIAYVNLAVIGLVDLQRVGIDDVLPTMVFKIAGHRVLLPGLMKERSEEHTSELQ